MSNQYLKLRRSAVPGKVPTTSSIDYGEIALNTYDGLAFMKKSGSNGEEVIAIGSPVDTGSFVTTSSFNNWTGSSDSQFAGTSSFAKTASYALNVQNVDLSGYVTTSSFNAWTGSSTSLFSGTASYITGSTFTSLNPALSASYALTASYAMNGGGNTDTGSLVKTASIVGGDNVSNQIQFTRGDNTSFTITVNTGSGAVSGDYVTTLSFNIFTSSVVTTSSFDSWTGSYSSQFEGTASISKTASYYQETDPIFVAKSASLATTGSNQFIGSQEITGSVSIDQGYVNIANGYFLQGGDASNNLQEIIGFPSGENYIRLAGAASDLHILGDTQITGTLDVNQNITATNFIGTASWAHSASNAVNAQTASYLETLNQDVTINGTASIDYLKVTYIESASIIYSSGSNQLGDNTNDTQSLYGRVIVSGSLEVTGAATIPNITGSLEGTASWATNALSSSYPISVTGSTIYSTGPVSNTLWDDYNTSNNIFLGTRAGYSASEIEGSTFIGYEAGYLVQGAYNSNFFGAGAGYSSSFANNSNFFGVNAGLEVTNVVNSNFFGYTAGYRATYAQSSNFFGDSSGQNATNAYDSNFFGRQAGTVATYANSSNFFGPFAGFQATNANQSNFFGNGAGSNATNAYDSNFFGYRAGDNATNAYNSNFFGRDAGLYAQYANYSTLIGYQVGANYNFINGIGRNNIIIGTNITLEENREDSINIGGIIFGTGSYFNSGSNDALYQSSGSANGKIGINVVNPQYTLDVSGSGNYSNGLTVTGSTYISNLTTASQPWVITYDTSSGQLYYTASSALGGGSTTNNYYNTSSFIATGSISASVNVGTTSFELVSGSSNFLFVSNSGNVGIGTTTPAYLLDVSGSGNYTNGLTITGSLIAPNITGSLEGTASWAKNAVTASYSTALGASLTSPANNQVRLLSSNGITLSTVTVNNVTSASYADTTPYASNANQLNGQLGSYYQNANNINAGTLGNAYLPSAINVTSVTASFTGSLVGALTGTASWATHSLTASHVNELEQTLAVSGAIRFDPTIDPDPSGLDSDSTFLFVSSSTTSLGYDLYVRQDGNLIKWKWIEGQLASGLLYGGILSYGGGNLYVKSGSGLIFDANASTGSEPSPIITRVNWNDVTQSLTYLTTATQTYVYVDSSGNVQQQTTFFTPDQYVNSIPIGLIYHSNKTTATAVGYNVYTTYNTTNQALDFINAFGPLRENGLTVSGQSGTMRLNISAGTAYVLGGFYADDPENVSHKNVNAVTTASIVRYYRSGSDFIADNNSNSFYTEIDSTKYDDGSGILATVGNSNWSIQRAFYNPRTNRVAVYYGQHRYSTLANALAEVGSDSFTEAELTAHNNVFVGYLIVEGGTNTDLTNTTKNAIVQAGLFRNTVGSAGSTSFTPSLASLTDVTITSPTDGQALVYSSGDWVNANPATASYVTGSAFTSANPALTASYSLTSSYIAANDLPANIDASKIGTGVVNNTEFSYLDGVTSAIQTQFTAKQDSITGAATTVTGSNLTANRVVISNTNGKIDISNTTDTEIGYVSGVTSAIQTQFSGKQSTITGAATTITSSNLTVNRAVISNASGKIDISTVTDTELGYVSGVTSAIQTQFSGKQASLTGNGFVKSTAGTISYVTGTSTQFVKADGTLDSSTYITAAITSLNGLTAATQTFASGTTGTDFSISSNTSTHTFNLPIASATNTGKLSSTDWTTFNNKVGSTRTISTTSPLAGGGDLSANRTLSITQATTSTDGYLSSTDWNTFNNKLSTSSFNSWTGSSTSQFAGTASFASAVDVSYIQRLIALGI